ncbi:Zinc finger CCCH domain-containing protein 41 [Forsythia ovata]|uniref:Zinc finger CCCH domain-containing protein 41 n=1 Tax=Forsythia ovata TaxID=205694 RepID=A0ABD1UV25_9LAMI
MELNVPSRKRRLSPSYCARDLEEKEISEGEDDDDDRNHKHRKQDTHSQFSEQEALDQVVTRPYRKRNKPFENGHPYRAGDSVSGETWKSYSIASERDFPARFEKRHPNWASFSRAPLDLNQRIQGNQSLSAEAGHVRGRGREPGSWGLHDSMFGSVDVASPLVQPGSVPSSLFAGRGLPRVSNTKSTSWSTFGLVPRVPNGGLDMLHSNGPQGTFKQFTSPVNIGILRQRCRDFEERGFCLRGDMCPMEHGVNHIVVEDVQSLSQFDLPVSLPSTLLLGMPSGQGSLPAISFPSSTLMNNKALHGKYGKPGVGNDGLGLNGCSVAGGSDVYDPDQPLWTNGCTEMSAPPLELNPSNAAITSPSYPQNDIKSDTEDFNTAFQDLVHHRKRMGVKNIGLQVKKSSLKPHSDSGRNVRKSSPKAYRTLFVNGIPQKDNKEEALLSHFQKFGEVTDIYIPLNSRRAFVQFSKREEAEAALKAPDAVMGNRFIKLCWANRDSVPDDGISGNRSVPITSHGITFGLAPSHPSVPDKGKENTQPAGPKDGNAQYSVAEVPAFQHSKPMVANSPKVPPLQKKVENLELLKEELRKKQQILDQKRSEFRRQLDKLEKQATKDITLDHPTKRLKGGTVPDLAKAETSRSSPRTNMLADNSGTAEHSLPCTPTSNPHTVAVLEPSSLRPSICPLAPQGAPFLVNRFKLDTRPTAFKIVSPLPTGLENVAVLEEHFSTFGNISSVELEELVPQESTDASEPSNISARISFKTHPSAERAFLNDANVHSTVEAAQTHSQNAASSGSSESENLTSESDVICGSG